MTYDFKAVRGPLRFSVNSGGMELLCAAMVESGVPLDRHRLRSGDPSYSSTRTEGNLLTCFSSNDGWHVTGPEARDIADCIEAALPGWIANPKVVHHKDVYIYARRFNKKGEPTEFDEAYAMSPDDPPRDAREIGASERRTAWARRFIEFCRGASKVGGCYVY